MSMHNQQPDVTDEEIGMRSFQIKKARAVERAIERLRKGLGAEWAKFTQPEIEAIGYVLGELWAYIAHAQWEDLRFSTLSVTDARRILNFARELTHHSRNSVDVLQDLHKMIVEKG
jgi:hypothetical protein